MLEFARPKTGVYFVSEIPNAVRIVGLAGNLIEKVGMLLTGAGVALPPSSPSLGTGLSPGTTVKMSTGLPFHNLNSIEIKPVRRCRIIRFHTFGFPTARPFAKDVLHCAAINVAVDVYAGFEPAFCNERTAGNRRRRRLKTSHQR